jgi:hypothetical protein
VRLRRSSISALASVALAALVAEPNATAATFTATPAPTVVEGGGPLNWAFVSDAPGTMWGDVTWRASTEPEWHMCGGPSGEVTLEGLAPGTYWVEIADEVDLAFAGEALGLPPFDRCSVIHSPALGPLHPVTLAATVVVAPPPPPPEPTPPASSTMSATSATTTTTVVAATPPPRRHCHAHHRRRGTELPFSMESMDARRPAARHGPARRLPRRSQGRRRCSSTAGKRATR